MQAQENECKLLEELDVTKNPMRALPNILTHEGRKERQVESVLRFPTRRMTLTLIFAIIGVGEREKQASLPHRGSQRKRVNPTLTLTQTLNLTLNLSLKPNPNPGWRS